MISLLQLITQDGCGGGSLDELTRFYGLQRHRHVGQRDDALWVHRTGVRKVAGWLCQEDGARTGGGGHSTGSLATVVAGLGLEVSQGEFGLALELVPVKTYANMFTIITTHLHKFSFPISSVTFYTMGT